MNTSGGWDATKRNTAGDALSIGCFEAGCTIPPTEVQGRRLPPARHSHSGLEIDRATGSKPGDAVLLFRCGPPLPKEDPTSKALPSLRSGLLLCYSFASQRIVSRKRSGSS